MNARYLPVLITIVLIMGLSPPTTSAQALQFVTTLTFNHVLLEPSLLSLSQPRESLAPPLTDRGAPRKRKGGASHFATTGN